MSVRNHHFLKLLDFSPTELEQLLHSALTLKRLRLAGHERKVLEGKDLALLFEKSCPQTRWTIQAAAASQGVSASFFGSGESGLGEQDSLFCNSMLLGRLFGALAVFGVQQERIEELARLSGVPVLNLGSQEFHPIPILADLATMMEHSSKPLNELSVTLLGDGTTNLSQSAIVGASKLGLDLRFCGPKELHPDETLTETCLALAAETGAQIRLFTEAEEAIKGADFVITQSWSIGSCDELKARVEQLLPYRATTELLSDSGNTRCHFIHHLPLVFGEETDLAQSVTETFDLNGLEASRELFESAASLCFEQAENQLHCTKAALISLLS